MYWSAIFLMALGSAQAQLTAQSSIAPELRDCYTIPYYINKNNLPPTTIQVLIDIIKKIEDDPNVNMDLRQLAAVLLHTYRQDGVEYHQPEVALGANVLPFAPTFHSFHRHRLLLTRLIPNNLQVLANNTITTSLKCALHSMLSTTVDARVRGDESSCNQLSQYRAMRTPRDTSSIDDDVEILDPKLINFADKNGQMRQFNPKGEVDFTSLGGSKSERQLLGASQCPILGGVVHTSWGAVSAGNLIAGIAAGAQSQQVPVLELTKGSVLNYPSVQQYVTSIYPATLSGDLAEAILIQGTDRGSSSISIGTAGNWNSTHAPRHFMIHSTTNVEMTDPEIRGDIDGFVIGSSLTSTLSIYNTLKLSQLLDMYYSPRNGIFNPTMRACNRRELSQNLIVREQLLSETYTFAAALDTNIPLRGTITGGLDSLVDSAVTNFQTYATSNMNDLNCDTTETASVDYRVRTNLYIVLDASWQYQAIYPAISYLLNNIEVGKYGSSVTLLSAFNGDVLINKTFSMADFHGNYTLTNHQSFFTGVNLEATFTNIKNLMWAELAEEKNRGYVGGNSTVLLFLLNAGNVQNNLMVLEQARILNETVPDLRIIFGTATNQFDNLWNLVRDMHNDIKIISLTTSGTNVEATMGPVLERITQVGLRVINPLCGSEYPLETPSGNRNFEDFLEPGYINFYSVSPNYFWENHEDTKVRITRTSASSGSLIICHSRQDPKPRQRTNSTGDLTNPDAVVCQNLAAAGNVEISLHNACSGYYTISSCPLLYFSVQSVPTSATTTATCTVNACRFPYNIRYSVQIEQLRCASGGSAIKASVFLMSIAFLLKLFKLM